MSDPAIEAAQRAWESFTIAPYPTVPNTTSVSIEMGAQAALTPLRAEVERLQGIWTKDNEEHKSVRAVLDRLATFIYPSEEL